MVEKEKLTQIVKEVQRDAGKFELLYSQIINKVYFWCYTVIGNETDAKDAAQEAMVDIYRNIPSLQNPEMFNTWMYRLVRNNCLTYIRLHKKKEVEFLHDEDYRESFETTLKEERRDNMPHEAYDLKETKELITSFINNLPKRQKEVITLYYLDEMKIGEIAEVLDYNVGSVKSRLHAGRKSLETQISEYQIKNNVKLYTAPLLPMIGLILNEYREEMCGNQDLHFDNNAFKATNTTAVSNVATIISGKVLAVAIVTVVTIIASVVGARYWNQTNDGSSVIKLSDSMVVDVDMFNKANSNPYIESINYETFPTKDSLEIVIKLKKNVDEKDIEISSDSKQLSFEKDKKDITFKVAENGKYTVEINNKRVTFTIDVIDPYAPQLLSIDNYGSYLQLHVDDELSQVDYELSYVEYDGEQYIITNDLKVMGKFKGKIEVSIYIDENCYRKYLILTN